MKVTVQALVGPAIASYPIPLLPLSPQVRTLCIAFLIFSESLARLHLAYFSCIVCRVTSRIPSLRYRPAVFSNPNRLQLIGDQEPLHVPQGLVRVSCYSTHHI